MASPSPWTWVWASSRSWWWIGKPGMLQSMGSQRVGHDWATELNWLYIQYLIILLYKHFENLNLLLIVSANCHSCFYPWLWFYLFFFCFFVFFFFFDFPKKLLFSKCIWTPIWELPFIKYKSHYFVIKYHKQQYCCAYMLLPFPKMSSTPLKGCSAISLLYHITYTRVLTKFLF